jgi:murein DD-endopeptidase MepM/ murein hydrolase activator NlpD
MYKKIKINFRILFLSVLTLLILSGNSAIYAGVAWVKPIQGTIANPFGNGYVFYGYYRAGHTGIDIKAEIGTPVVASKEGIVRYIQTKPNMRYGYYVVIEHDNGLHTLYGHLQKILVPLNKRVNQGEVIATSGISGLASYPHLHFEITDKIPVRDGAWGYNYICKMKKGGNPNIEDIREDKILPGQIVDFIPFPEIQQKFNFLNAYQKQFNYFYRMKKNHCIEEPISPLTYYNPELFLPAYEKSSLPDFSRWITRKKIKDLPQKQVPVTAKTASINK